MSTNKQRKRILIVGGGPAGLMAASQLLESNCEILIVDHKSSIGRKFLVAGDGGFNLTHSEPIDAFLDRYDNDWIRNCVSHFTNSQFIQFLRDIGIPTVIGSSGKIFPEPHIKPIQVLNAWKAHLGSKVNYQLGWRLSDFDAHTATFIDGENTHEIAFDYVILALGGKSWSVTGSDGQWTEIFANKSIELVPFRASNSGLELPQEWLTAIEGQIIKNVYVSSKEIGCHGDVVCTKYGLEGKPIYAVNRGVRISTTPEIFIDLKPQFSLEQVKKVLDNAATSSHGLKALKLNKVAIQWMKEFLSKEAFTDRQLLARAVKAFRVPIAGFRPLDEVISTVGGVSIHELDETGALRKFPTIFCAGEMVDWDAPTGGYLIQGCVSSGWMAGQTIKKLITDRSEVD